MKRVAVVVFACAAAAGCASPEAARQRGGGPGADPGNRPAGPVRLHEGSRQYWQTPVRIEGARMPLEPSEQARRISVSSGSPNEGVR